LNAQRDWILLLRRHDRSCLAEGKRERQSAKPQTPPIRTKVSSDDLLVDRRCLSLPYVRVQVAQLDSCVVGGEVPVDLTLVGVGLLLPGGELGVEHGEVLDAAV